MFFRVLQIAIPFGWFGMVGAISFMEAPLKFRAPGITLPLGLGIGRIIFQTPNKIEIVLAATMIISIWIQGPRGKVPVYLLAAAIIILVLETFWLLPVLDARAAQVINGTAGPYSNTHVIYIAMDATKLILLFSLGVSLVKRHLRFD